MKEGTSRILKKLLNVEDLSVEDIHGVINEFLRLVVEEVDLLYFALVNDLHDVVLERPRQLIEHFVVADLLPHHQVVDAAVYLFVELVRDVEV